MKQNWKENLLQWCRKWFSVACCLSLLSGCATIMSGSMGTAVIKSDPSGAKFTIFRNGQELHSGVTPQSVQLKKRGRYSIRLERDGYEPLEARIKKGVSGWYIGGNLIFGGVIGYLIVDPLSGAMFTFPEKKTFFKLQKKVALLGLEASEGLVLIDIQSFSAEERKDLVPLLNLKKAQQM